MRLFFFLLSIFFLFDWVSSSPPSPPSTTCKIKSNDSLSEVLELCQGVDTFNLGRYIFNGLSQADFNHLFLTVKRIYGQNSVHGWIEFTNTKLVIMDFSQLDDIWLVNIIITGNPNLKELLFPVINRITVGDSHGLIIANNPQLEILHFPKIEILYGGSHHYENNTALRSIQFGRLNTVLLDSFVVLKNPALEIIEIILSRKTLDFIIREILRIEDNESLKEIVFRHEEGEIARWWILNEMTIVNNRNLLSIPSEFCEGNRTMTIRGNAQLSREILAELRAAANESSSQIQEFGECIFKEPLKNLAALDVCVYVYGQLELAASVEGWTSVRLDRVEGDVYTSEVPIGRLDFLMNTEIRGKFESSLCDFDFSGFREGKKGRRRGCQTTRERSTVEGSTTRGRWTTRRDGESSMTAVTTEITTTVTRKTVETTTEGSGTATVTQTTKKIGRETTEMTKEATRNSTTEKIPTPAERSLTSTTVPVPTGSFPYRPVIIVSAVLLVFFILLGAVLWAKKRKSKMEKQLTEDLNSPSSEVSTSTISSR